MRANCCRLHTHIHTQTQLHAHTCMHIFTTVSIYIKVCDARELVSAERLKRAQDIFEELSNKKQKKGTYCTKKKIVMRAWYHARAIWCQNSAHDTEWQRVIGCLIFTGYFPRKRPIISGSFAGNDLQLKASYGSSPLIWCNNSARDIACASF